jgi:hypothetical protein
LRRSDIAGSLYDLVTGDEDARVCKDIPDSACSDQPQNFFLQLGANVCTKIGDELASAKLVLPWLLSAAGAPGFFIGLLVPIRESLSLLPQLFVAAAIRARAIRKWFWVGGSVVQGLPASWRWPPRPCCSRARCGLDDRRAAGGVQPRARRVLGRG